MSGPVAIPTKAEAGGQPLPDDFLWHVHGNLSEQIKFCDQKSGFVALLATGLMGAMHSQLFSNTAVTWGVVQVWGILTFLFLAGALVACFISIMPRSRYTTPRGFIFWGAIAAYESWNEFTQDLMGAPPGSLTEHLSHQTYALARICKDKYAWLNRGMALAAWGTGMAAGSFVISWAISSK